LEKTVNLKEETDSVEQLSPPSKISPRQVLAVGLLLSIIAGGVWYFHSTPPSGILSLSGRLEGYETDIGAKVPGRINFVAVREGDLVKQGQIIVRQDNGEIQAQLQGAKARRLVTEHQERQAALQIEVLKSQIRELEINRQQAQQDAEGRIIQSQAALASSQAQLNQVLSELESAQAQLKLDQLNQKRLAQLVAEGAIPQQQFDVAQTTLETGAANVKARQASVVSFQKLVKAAEGQLKQSQTTAFNPKIRQAQIQSLSTQLAQARWQKEVNQAEIAKAQAEILEIESRVSDLNLLSPINGVVTARSVEPGVVVAAGKTLLTIIDPKTIYLRGYVPEGEIGKVKVGQQARVFLDSLPKQPFSARVTAIDTQASFTPENIYFQDDRVKQVFGVKISLENPQGLAKPGMPVDAEILTSLP
jgi:HlyD family secretion protein